MKDDFKKIYEVPEFESDIDPTTLANIKTEESRALAIYMSKERQRSRWVAERMLEAYNMSVSNTAFIRKYGPIITGLIAIGGVLLYAIASGIGEKLIK